MPKVIYFFAIIVLSGCATPTYMEMYKLQGAGKPDQAIALFDKELTIEKSDKDTLLPLCNSLRLMHEFERFNECINAYEAKTDSDTDQSLVETYRAGMYYGFGNFERAKQEALKSIENDKNILPIGPYEWLARIAIKEGNKDEAYAYIEKIDKLKITLFGISLAEDSIGEVKRDVKTRIYLDLNEPELAAKTLKTPLPGKSMGEYIFMAAIDFLETDADKVINTLADWAAPEETQNWYFMNEVNSLWVYGQVALANKNYRDAIQSFRRMLNLPNIEKLRFFYIEGNYYLSKAYQEYGDMEKSERYKNLLDHAVIEDAPKIPWPAERESFKKQYSL